MGAVERGATDRGAPRFQPMTSAGTSALPSATADDWKIRRQRTGRTAVQLLVRLPQTKPPGRGERSDEDAAPSPNLVAGERPLPHAAGVNPNWEYNERNTVVVFVDFSERKNSEAGARFLVKLESVADETRVILVGPSGKELGGRADMGQHDLGI
jgi:hypothetical protein